MRTLFTVLLGLICLHAHSQKAIAANHTNNSVACITPKLNLPFGSIAKLDVQIYDGDSLQMKNYEDSYLLKVTKINDRLVTGTILLTFTDETGKLANDNFGLFQLLYSKTAASLTDTQVSKMKKNYVGKRITLQAYETGRFTGIPTDYFNYQPVRADTDFHFEQQLVVVAIMEK